jgi:dUTP pyrophosphatase
MNEVLIFSKTGNLPKRATPTSSGFDLRADVSNAEWFGEVEKIKEGGKEYLLLYPFARVKIPLGIFTAPANRMDFELTLRSSIGWLKGLVMPNSPGIIDSDYRGEWCIVVINVSGEVQSIDQGERIAQARPTRVTDFDFLQVESVEELPATVRGGGGFGSTGTT